MLLTGLSWPPVPGASLKWSTSLRPEKGGGREREEARENRREKGMERRGQKRREWEGEGCEREEGVKHLRLRQD